ncbi:hypothetical protein TWF718_004597 [Orbilia javanica]|uniref:Uncharacterized protein n=1 Tax=Orbilia javanica TaxID=47235 RepID=A0AAN8MXU8_9PEZI
MRKRVPWLILLWIELAGAAILDAGAVVQLSQANETAANAGEDGISGVEIDKRQVSEKPLGTPTYTSYIMARETITAPPVTITSFYTGPNGEEGSPSPARSAGSTAASILTPTGTCSLPPTVTAPCIIGSNGKCVKDYYNALQSCYKDGTFSTLKNIAQYVIECQSELGDSGSYNGFRDCSQNSLENQLNGTGVIERRSLVSGGSPVAFMGDNGGQLLGSRGFAMMDEGSFMNA